MRYYKISLFLAFIVVIAIIIAAQFSIPTLFDADGYLHIRMAKFIRLFGVSNNFHWARYSEFNHHFADKDFLYHVLLIPFTFFSDIFFGIKVATCLFSVFFLGVFFWVLRRYCQKRILIPFFLIALVCSGGFVQALCRARNMIFVIALTLLFVDFLIRKRQLALFITTVIYTLSHVTGPMLIAFALLCESARFFSGDGFAWRNMRAVALAVAVGLLVHPNFPNNVLFFYLNSWLVPIFSLKWGLELGAEFFPMDTRSFALGYPLILIGLVLFAAAAMYPGHNVKISTKIWMAISGFFFIFSFFSQRYLIYVYPLLLIALASYFSDWLLSKERWVKLRQLRWARLGILFSIIFAFVLISLNAYQVFKQRAISELVYNRHYENIGKWMSRYIPPGEIVFHSNWSDSQYFIGLNPQDDYFVTLDPIYMYYWDPKKYKLYREIAFGKNVDPYSALKKDFSVRYGYVGKDYFSGLISQVRNDSRFQVLAEDNFGLVFKLN